MARAIKYQCNFEDVNGIAWILLFDEEGWGGGITTLTPAANPAVFTWNQSDKYQTVIGSTAEIKLVYESAIDELYTEESQDIRLTAYRNAALFWQGFLSPGQYFRQFNQPVHTVTLTASDGLGELKGMKFVGLLDAPYYYSKTEIEIVATILQKTGLTQTIYDTIDVFEDGYAVTATDSPLEQTYIWPERYWDELTDNSDNCYTVLVDILKKYGASVRYSTGHWYLLRPNAFSAREDISYRVFTYAGVYSSNSTFTSYNTIDTDMFYIYANQEVSKLPGVGSAQVTLTPGKRTNDLKNGSFDDFTWNGSDPYYWTNSGATYDDTKIVDALTLYTNEAATQPTNYIYSEIIRYEGVKSIKLTLDYR